MDIERTMEFILEQQARNAVEHEKFERGLESLRTLVKFGMKLLVKVQQGQKELQVESTATKAEIRALARAQRKTDEKFQKLLAALLDQRGNGRPRKR
jgi:hypothetical protein